MARSKAALIDERQIAQYVDFSEFERHRARVRETGVHVWALIAYLHVVDGDTERTRISYGLSSAAMEAALAYYRVNKSTIDAWLSINSG